MRRDWMRRIRDIGLALLCTIAIVNVTTFDQPVMLEQPEFILAQELNEFEGIPEEIQGVWSYEGDMTSQSAILRGNQMVITDEYNGSVYYTIDVTQVEENFEVDGIEDNDNRTLYILNTNLNDYSMRYGEEEATMTTDSFYFVYDENEDILIPQPEVSFNRNAEEELAFIIQDNIVQEQPINREQLREVDAEFLVNQYHSHQEVGSEDIYLELYRDIANEYPDLNLLRNEDYEAYRDISSTIINHSELTYARLNQAGADNVLSLYQEAHTNDVSDEDLVKEIYPRIEAEIQAFHDRQLTYENSLRYGKET